LKRTSNETEFRGRSYLFAALEPDVIYEMPRWYRHPLNPTAATSENLNEACLEASMHGEHFYSNFVLYYQDLAMKNGLPFAFRTWEACIEEILTRWDEPVQSVLKLPPMLFSKTFIE